MWIHTQILGATVTAAYPSESYREAEQRAVQVDLDVAPVDRLLDGDIAPAALNGPALVDLVAEASEDLPGQVGADPEAADVGEDRREPAVGDVEARNGRWSLIADLFYADLSQSRPTPLGVLFSQVEIETEAKLLSGYAGYRVLEGGPVAVDLMAGFRVNSVDLDVSLAPGLLAGQRFGMSETWVDPLVGGRVRFAITDHWFATALVDVGGFRVGSDLTWLAFASFGYQIDERWSIQGGWRHVSIDKSIDGRDVEIDLNGPLLGFTVRF